MAYPKVSVLIQICRSESKYQRIRALVKAFHRWMKASLALRVKNSIPKELAFVKFGFLDLANFIIDDRFLISPSILSLLIQLGAT